MASAIFTSNSSSSSMLSLCAFSNSAILIPRNVNVQYLKCIPQLGLGLSSPWNGLKILGISISQHSVKKERKGKCKGKGVYASLFGVGAPEALVVGVVAVLVFGPKGLAEMGSGFLAEIELGALNWMLAREIQYKAKGKEVIDKYSLEDPASAAEPIRRFMMDP